MNEYNTIFYETVEGKMPAKDFLLSLDYDMRAKMYFYDEKKIIVLTNGFVKKEQKTPKNEIELAKVYRRDYFARKESK